MQSTIFTLGIFKSDLVSKLNDSSLLYIDVSYQEIKTTFRASKTDISNHTTTATTSPTSAFCTDRSKAVPVLTILCLCVGDFICSICFVIFCSLSVFLCLGKAVFRTCGISRVSLVGKIPASILRKSTSGRHRPVRVADGPMTAPYRFT